MLGAIIGDICGSVYERNNHKTEAVDEVILIRPDSYFTDDTVLTIAVADACLHDKNYEASIRLWGKRYPRAGYGSQFRKWLQSEPAYPYNSWGNGSAMRVGPVAWANNSLEEVLREAERSAEVTHNHPEGIRGAQATAAAVFLSRNGNSKDNIRLFIENHFGYDLRRSIATIRQNYTFDVSCQGTVPEALTVFLESRDFAHSLQLAVSIGGDTDTIACIVGGIAEAFYKEIPKPLTKFAWSLLTPQLSAVVTKFYTNFPIEQHYLEYKKTEDVTYVEPDSVVNIVSREYWFKIVGFFQQNWALVDINDDSTATVYFIHDRGGVFDKMLFPSKTDAEAGLSRNGFELYAQAQEAQNFLSYPKAPFQVAQHPNGRIYSSGKFWCR